MKTNQNQVLVKTLAMCAFVLVVFTGMSFGVVWENDSDCLFAQSPGSDPCNNGGGQVTGLMKPMAVVQSAGLGSYIVESAGHLLNSYSSSLLFLNRVEMASLNGLNTDELRETLYNSIEYLEKAATAHSLLNEMARVTPYNQEMIERLKAFDYKAFQEKKKLNPYVFATVTRYFRKGNVIDYYEHSYATIGNLLDQLYALKQTIDAGDFPTIESLWRLNQEYSYLLLVGQYVAEVSFAVTGRQ